MTVIEITTSRLREKFPKDADLSTAELIAKWEDAATELMRMFIQEKNWKAAFTTIKIINDEE